MRPKPVHLRLGPDTHPPDDRIAAWRAALGFSHDVLVTPEQREGFRGSFDGHRLGPVLLADMRATAHTACRDKALIARHALDFVVVDAVVEGGITGTFGQRHATVEPGDCVLVDLLTPLRIDVTDHRILTLVVPRPLFTERGADLAFVRLSHVIARKRPLPHHRPEGKPMGKLHAALPLQRPRRSQGNVARLGGHRVS